MLDVADDLNVEGSVEMQADDPIDDIDHPKENEEKEENKIMYRGKMRKLFTCQVGNCSYKTLLRKDIERHTRVHTGKGTSLWFQELSPRSSPRPSTSESFL